MLPGCPSDFQPADGNREVECRASYISNFNVCATQIRSGIALVAGRNPSARPLHGTCERAAAERPQPVDCGNDRTGHLAMGEKNEQRVIAIKEASSRSNPTAISTPSGEVIA